MDGIVPTAENKPFTGRVFQVNFISVHDLFWIHGIPHRAAVQIINHRDFAAIPFADKDKIFCISLRQFRYASRKGRIRVPSLECSAVPYRFFQDERCRIRIAVFGICLGTRAVITVVHVCNGIPAFPLGKQPQVPFCRRRNIFGRDRKDGIAEPPFKDIAFLCGRHQHHLLLGCVIGGVGWIVDSIVQIIPNIVISPIQFWVGIPGVLGPYGNFGAVLQFFQDGSVRKFRGRNGSCLKTIVREIFRVKNIFERRSIFRKDNTPFLLLQADSRESLRHINFARKE